MMAGRTPAVTDFEHDDPRGDAAVDDTVVPRRARVDDFTADGECLVYHAARDEASALNRTATEVWQLCDGRLTVGAIAAVLGQRYEVDAALLLDEVSEVLAAFRERGLVDFCDGPVSDVT
jgi:hypothetical protein